MLLFQKKLMLFDVAGLDCCSRPLRQHGTLCIQGSVHTQCIYFFGIQPESQVLEDTLQRHCTENFNQIVLEMKLRILIHNSYIHVYVRNFYIPRICLLILLQQNRWTDPGNI
jgi:hypothetical protein